jgi:glycosyltransferase involved in cell wall biosynthesis
MVAGEGDLNKYEEYAEKLGIKRNVQFLGKRSDLDQLYATANLFVLPSRREGMSNALLEAMMNGLPCVATNISGNQDIIETGVNGLLVPPADVEALATAILKMLKDQPLAESMGKRGRETILEHFDISSVATQYRSVYNQMIHAQ